MYYEEDNNLDDMPRVDTYYSSPIGIPKQIPLSAGSRHGSSDGPARTSSASTPKRNSSGSNSRSAGGLPPLPTIHPTVHYIPNMDSISTFGGGNPPSAHLRQPPMRRPFGTRVSSITDLSITDVSNMTNEDFLRDFQFDPEYRSDDFVPSIAGSVGVGLPELPPINDPG